jgi:hypothetical protein
LRIEAQAGRGGRPGSAPEPKRAKAPGSPGRSGGARCVARSRPPLWGGEAASRAAAGPPVHGDPGDGRLLPRSLSCQVRADRRSAVRGGSPGRFRPTACAAS